MRLLFLSLIHLALTSANISLALDQVSLSAMAPGDIVTISARSSSCFDSSKVRHVFSRNGAYKLSIFADEESNPGVVIKDLEVYEPDIKWLDAEFELLRKQRMKICDIQSTSNSSIELILESPGKDKIGEWIATGACTLDSNVAEELSPFGTNYKPGSGFYEFSRNYFPYEYRGIIKSVKNWPVPENFGGKLEESAEAWLRRVAGKSAVINWDYKRTQEDPSTGRHSSYSGFLIIRGLARWENVKSLSVTQAVRIDLNPGVRSQFMGIARKDLVPFIKFEVNPGTGPVVVRDIAEAEKLVGVVKP